MKFKRRKKNPLGVRKGIYLLPNLCTTGNLFCGFYSIVASWKGDFNIAAWTILLAGIFDLLDGRIARLTGAQSSFGVEYDSLVDLSSFGLAPGMLIYAWSLHNLAKFGWLAVFLYFACGALRLARFNVQHDNLESTDFEGLPIPGAAYLLATFVIFLAHTKGAIFTLNNWGILGIMVGLSLLMVSPIKYRSLKMFDLRSRSSFFALVALVIIIFVVAIEPNVVMFFLVAAYVMSGVIEELVTFKKTKKMIQKYKDSRSEEVEDSE